MRRLAALGLQSKRRGRGVSAGQQRSLRRGQSQEFADHRPYSPGDDLRFLDWHLYGRLDTLWVKLFQAEDDRVVQILLDSSGSMEGVKLDYAKRVAAALSWVALHSADRVSVAAITNAIASYQPPRRGRSTAAKVFQSIEAVHPGGDSAPGRAVQQLPRHRGTGVALLFTDLLYPEGPDAALKRLAARGHEIHVFHVIEPAELRPQLDGDYVLVDAESGLELPMTVDADVLDRYEATVNAWADDMALTCRKLGAGYTRLLTSQPVEELVLTDLRRAGLVG